MKKNWMMYLRGCVLGLMVLAAMRPSAAQDCPPVPHVSSEDMQRLARSGQPDRGPLWELSKNGRRSYLYGTIHVARLEWDFPGPLVTKALMASKVLAVELDIGKPETGQRMLAPMPTQAADATSPRYQAMEQEASTQFKKACIDERALAGSGLAIRLAALSVLSARHAGLYPDFSIDSSIIGFSRYFKKKIHELETTEEQRAALGGSTLEELQEDLDDIKSGRVSQITQRLAALWSEGSLGDIERFCTEEHCTANQRLFGPRNTVLAQRIARLMESQGDVFCAIGFLHMIGPDSVLAQLKAMGFEVRQLTALPRT